MAGQMKWLKNLDLICSGAVLVFLAVVTVAQVFCRYVLLKPILYADAVASYSLEFITFIGSIYVYRKRDNLIGFYALRDSLPRIPRLILSLIMRVIATGVFGVISVSFMAVILHNRNIGNPYLYNMPYWLYFGPGFVGFACMTVISVLYIVRDVRAILGKAADPESVSEIHTLSTPEQSEAGQNAAEPEKTVDAAAGKEAQP